MRRKYGTGTELLETNYPFSFHRGPDTWIMPFCCNHMVEVHNDRLTAFDPGQPM